MEKRRTAGFVVRSCNSWKTGFLFSLLLSFFFIIMEDCFFFSFFTPIFPIFSLLPFVSLTEYLCCRSYMYTQNWGDFASYTFFKILI